MVGQILSGIMNLANQRLQTKQNEDFQNFILKKSSEINSAEADRAANRQAELYMNYLSPKAKLKQIKAAELSPALMYTNGGGISGTMPTAPQATAGTTGTPSGIVNPAIGFSAAAELKNLQEAKSAEEQQKLWAAEKDEVYEKIKKIKGDIDLQDWNAGHLATVSGAQLNSWSKGSNWNNSWSKALGWNISSSVGENASHTEGWNGGVSGGANISIMKLGGGKSAAPVSLGNNFGINGGTQEGNSYGYNISGAVGVNGSKSEAHGEGSQRAQTFSNSESYQCYFYPVRNEKGEITTVNVVILNRYYPDISIGFDKLELKANEK